MDPVAALADEHIDGALIGVPALRCATSPTFIGIDAIVLVRQRSFSSHVAHDHAFDPVDQHVMQPLGLCSFLEGCVHTPPGGIPYQRHNRRLFRRTVAFMTTFPIRRER
ncbi:MAG TPA: hypothetical protein VGQ36_29140 [Thermoanaerobaculia bacterium]|jgi:hypothetical protein|nr:hypothetical protein [Thermoanaerobaculia bacterium]